MNAPISGKRCNFIVAVLVSCMSVTLLSYADTLDLEGSGRTVTDVAELAAYDCVTNSAGGDPVTLTFSISSSDVTNAVAISGNIKVVKEGAGMLTFSADNSYSGGTEINEGKLRGTSDNPFGSDHANNPIYVNTDLTDGRSLTSDTSTAIVFAKAGTSASAPQTYGYPITCSAWSNHGARPGGTGKGSGTLYNIALAEDFIKLTGDITGGDISIRCGTIGYDSDKKGWNTTPKGKSNPAISGNITAVGGALSLSSRAAEFNLSGVVKVEAIYHPVAGDYPTKSKLSNPANEIGLYDCGRYNSGGQVTASASGALGGAILISTTANFAKTGLQNISQSFYLVNYNHTINYPTIDYFTPRLPSDSVGMDTPHSIFCDKTLTMAATATATNDWCFSNYSSAGASTASLVWAPQGDFWLYNVSREHQIGGTITVNRGGFAMDANCSFSNVSAIVVGANAVFSNDCAIAGSLMGVTAITLGAGAKAYLPADALTAGAVTLTLDPTSEVVFPDGTEVVTFANIVLDGNHLVADTYALPQVKGASLVANLNTSGIVDREAATWDGGGEDKKVGTKENWDGDTLPLFDLLGVDATFGTSGDEAVAEGTIRLNSVVFDAPGDFTLSADDGARFKLGNGGVTGVDKEDAPHTYTIAAPVVVSADQNWHFGTNALPVFGGSMYDPGYEGVTNTVSVSAYNPIWMVGHGQTDYVGKWRFYNRSLLGGNRTYSSLIFATGVEPFGGAGATVSIAGGRQGGNKLNIDVIKAAHGQDVNNVNWLIVSNATVSSAIDIPYSSAEDRYGVALFVPDNTTNVFNGTVSNLRQIRYGADCMLTFNGPVNIHADNIGADASLCFRFQYVGTAETLEALKRSKVVFNGRVTYPDGLTRIGRMDTMAYAKMHFNASSNVVAAVGTTLNTYFTLYTGADYAFAEGRTKLTFRTGGVSYLYLDGHSQHIGSISAGHANTTIGTTDPCELRISQTNDVTYLGNVDSKITIAKDGDATLTLDKALGSSMRLIDGTLSLANGVTAAAAENSVVTFEDGTLELGADARVFKAYYLDANDQVQPLPRGTYSAGDDSPIGASLSGAGRLIVRKSDIVTGMKIIFR